MFNLKFALAAFVAVVSASPLEPRWDDLQLKYSWNGVPKGWVHHASPPEGSTIDLKIGFKAQEENALVDTLYAVSDPEHARYGAHLSQSDVAALVAPHPDTHTLVSAWLVHHGIPLAVIEHSAARDWLHLSAVPVSTANALLGADYQIYRHADTNTTLLRTTGYALPSVLHAHVAVVAPTTYFGALRPMRATSSRAPAGAPVLADGDASIRDEIAKLAQEGLAAVPRSCASTITPACLRALYNSTSYVPKATAHNKLGIAGYLEQYANFVDLQTFVRKFRTDARGANFSVVLVNGGKNDQKSPGDEANLDMQYAEGISFPTPNTYYSTGGSPPFIADGNTPENTNEPYLDFLDFLLAQKSIPQTLSTSYGDDEQTVPLDYAQSVCAKFAQLGARGTSVLFSSGDSGVGNSPCLSNDGTYKVEFIPNFPASCPFVTAVGGTTSIHPEVAAGLSSGGFSNYFARPDYQAKAVSTFLKQVGSQYAGLFNTTGRGFPDVAAQAINFQVVIDGFTESVDGTSCSAPTFSAIVALLNDYRLSRGKPSLGFLNPLLYSRGIAGLNDITSGTNPGCGTDGFTAVKGWDPVTGLGTPDFGKLQAIVG